MFHASPLEGKGGISIYFTAGLISNIHTFSHPLLGSAVFAQVVYKEKKLEDQGSSEVHSYS